MAEEPQEQSVFRRYWWALLIALFLVALCCGVAGGAFGRDIIDQLTGKSATESPTEGATEPPSIEIPTDSPTATGEIVETEITPSATATATSTSTPTATATRPAGSNVTCRCSGTDYVCSNGSTTKNSPKCPTAVPPTVTSAPAACTAGWKPASGCTCCGYDLYCADGSVGVFNPQCACKCEGTTFVCADGGRIPNSTECGYKP
jgi:hypothetical protein